MRNTFIFVLLLALIGGGIYYFAGDRDFTSIPAYQSLARLSLPTSTDGTVLGESINESKKTFNTMKEIAQNPSRAINDITINIKEGILDQVAAVLGMPTSTEERSDNEANNTETITVGVSAQGELDVCSVYGKGKEVSYRLDFGTSGASAAYSVDWGDGNITWDNAATSSESLLISHVYEKEGNYTVKFAVAGSIAELVAGSEEPLDQRLVCVQ